MLSFDELKNIFQAIERKKGFSIVKRLKQDFVDDYNQSLIYFIEFVADPHFYYSNHLKNEMLNKGLFPK